MRMRVLGVKQHKWSSYFQTGAWTHSDSNKFDKEEILQSCINHASLKNKDSSFEFSIQWLIFFIPKAQSSVLLNFVWLFCILVHISEFPVSVWKVRHEQSCPELLRRFLPEQTLCWEVGGLTKKLFRSSPSMNGDPGHPVNLEPSNGTSDLKVKWCLCQQFFSLSTLAADFEPDGELAAEEKWGSVNEGRLPSQKTSSANDELQKDQTLHQLVI